MECPVCEYELLDHGAYWRGRPEYFTGTTSNGIHYPATPDYKILGRIYKCENEECELFEQSFYTKNGDLIEGYPC